MTWYLWRLMEMYLQKVISKVNSFLSACWKPLTKRAGFVSSVQIQGSGSFSKCHGSGDTCYLHWIICVFVVLKCVFLKTSNQRVTLSKELGKNQFVCLYVQMLIVSIVPCSALVIRWALAGRALWTTWCTPWSPGRWAWPASVTVGAEHPPSWLRGSNSPSDLPKKISRKTRCWSNTIVDSRRLLSAALT